MPGASKLESRNLLVLGVKPAPVVPTRVALIMGQAVSEANQKSFSYLETLTMGKRWLTIGNCPSLQRLLGGFW
jgi:hypothetical protein